jgi:hypothetical protein
MRLVLLLVIGLLLIDVGLMGNFGSLLGAVIDPEAMVDLSPGS